MKDLLTNYSECRKICVCFLKKKFNTARFTDADFDDIVSTAVEKILTKPSLSSNLPTLLYIANLSAIDLFRKRRKETLVGDFPIHTPLSIWGNDDVETKHLLELVITEVGRLNDKRRTLMEQKYHAYTFPTTVSQLEMMTFKSQMPTDSKQMAAALGYPSALALRQETFRTVNQLRTRLAA